MPPTGAPWERAGVSNLPQGNIFARAAISKLMTNVACSKWLAAGPILFFLSEAAHDMNAKGDEEAAWRAFPIYTSMGQEELESRIAAGMEPETPEEYILRVRHEAKGIPDVVVAEHVNPRHYDAAMTTTLQQLQDALNTTDTTHSSYLPGTDWSSNVLLQFDRIRKRIEALELTYECNRGIRPSPSATAPNVASLKAWERFCFGEWASYDDEDGSVTGSTPAEVVVSSGSKRSRPDSAGSPVMPAKRGKGQDITVDEDAYSSSDEEVTRVTQLVALQKQLALQKRKIAAESSAQGPTLPSMSILLNFDQPQTARVIRRLTTHYRRRFTAGHTDDRAQVAEGAASKHAAVRGTLCSGTGPTAANHNSDDEAEDLLQRDPDEPLAHVMYASECAWLYCFLARLDTPLLPEVSSVIRHLFQLCRQQRSRVADYMSTASEDEIPAALERIGALNVLVVVCGQFFEQRLPGEC